MAQVIVVQRMWQRRDTAENWTARNPVLADGEIGFERDVPTTYVKMKVGDGSTPWNDLDYFAGGGGTVEMRVDSGYIQFSNDGVTWENVISVAELQGEPGDPGPPSEMQSSGGYVQWRPVGTSTWFNLFPLSDITGEDGEDGREVQLQKSATHIQWRYVGDATWTNLVPLSDITGPAGADAVGAATRSTVTLASGTGTAAVGKTALLLKIAASAEARIRFYSTAAARTADASRAANVAAAQGSGLLLEFIAVTALLGAPLTPGIIGYNLDTTPTGVIYYNIQPVGGAMTVDLTFLKLEN